MRPVDLVREYLLHKNDPPPQPYDWPKKLAEAEVKAAIAIGFLRTIPSDDTSAEEGEAWRERLRRFLGEKSDE